MINPLDPLEVRNNLTSNLDPKPESKPENPDLQSQTQSISLLLRCLRDQASWLSSRISEASRAIQHSEDSIKNHTKNKVTNSLLRDHYINLLSEVNSKIDHQESILPPYKKS